MKSSKRFNRWETPVSSKSINSLLTADDREVGSQREKNPTETALQKDIGKY